ncbi:MAG TPA: EAL domain-containing protein [Epsilonproteobacteria bacterium]|nr:EAL domain-containing protein [Campylobacterota bacterium]
MNKQYDFEKLKYLYNAVPIVLTTHLVSALLYGLIMWQYVDNRSLAVWLSVMIVVILFRAYHYVLYSNTSDDELQNNSTLWLHRYFTYILIMGGLWGSTAILLFPQHEIQYQMVTVLFILGITATALGIIAASWYLVIAYVLLSFTPLVIRLSWINEPIYITFSYIVSALGILMLFTSKYFESILEKSIVQQYSLGLTAKKLDDSLHHLYRFIENAPIGVFMFDKDLTISKCNNRMAEILELESAEILHGYDLSKITDTRILPALKNVLNGEEGHYEGTFYSYFTDSTHFIKLFCVPITGFLEEEEMGICFFKDQTSELHAQETIQENAFYDPLTKLPNRTLFSDRLTIAIEQSSRHKHGFAILFLDLDHFKHINDNLGHYIGDQLLFQVSQQLLSCVRTEDTVARIGGDEFIVLLNMLPADETEKIRISMDIASNIIETIGHPHIIEEHELSIGGSIGVYIQNDDAKDSPADIIKKADVAMYHAKHTGRNHATLYHKDFEATQQTYISMDKNLRLALERDEFELYFQPKVAIKSNSIEKVEALIRWHHPEKGLVYPNTFIPFAEESGFIVKIGEWVIEQSVRQIKKWKSDKRLQKLQSVAINVSIQQIEQPDFVDYMKAVIMVHNIPPSMIELEMTESVMMKNSFSTIEKIKALESFGIRVALDDFGTGYSSLSYLKNLPVSVIKIDRSFVVDLKENQNTLMIVRTIIDIAKNMGISVVAEGVESNNELSILEQLGCDYYQGFLCDSALPAAELEQLLVSKIQ